MTVCPPRIIEKFGDYFSTPQGSEFKYTEKQKLYECDIISVTK